MTWWKKEGQKGTDSIDLKKIGDKTEKIKLDFKALFKLLFNIALVIGFGMLSNQMTGGQTIQIQMSLVFTLLLAVVGTVGGVDLFENEYAKLILPLIVTVSSNYFTGLS